MGRRIGLVTGASGAIGGAFVERLAHEGWHVLATGRPGRWFDEACARWTGNPAIEPVSLDVTNAGDVAAIAARLERLDLLVNNAAAYVDGDGGLPPVEVLERNLAINLVAPYRMIHACVPALASAGRAVVLNVSSGAGAIGAVAGDGPLGYRTSKAALNMLTRSLAHTLRGQGISVHAADPGWVRSRLNPAGSESPEQAVDGMWHLVDLHDEEASGCFWLRGQRLAW